MNRIRLAYFFTLCILAVVDAAAAGTQTIVSPPENPSANTDAVQRAPLDFGWGPRPGTSTGARAGAASSIEAAAEGFREFDGAALVPGSEAHIKGAFGNPITWPWPIIPIHAALMPDGKVHTFGGANYGAPEGMRLWHDVWDPRLGTNSASHTRLPNSTSTDIFCAAQSLLPRNGKLLITGGDISRAPMPLHSGVADTNIFDYSTQVLAPDAPMHFRRWYPTLVALPSGKMLVLGGRVEGKGLAGARVATPTPEIYTPGRGWQVLTTATNHLAYGVSNGSWYYPRAFLAPNGQVFILAHHGEMFYLNPTGTGSIKQIRSVLAPPSKSSLPTVSFAPGKLISLRLDRKAIIVDLNTLPPTLQQTAPISSMRHWSNATVLADGKVMVSGGSGVGNRLVNVRYDVEIWNPATGSWTLGAAAQKPRLYHSVALLLPDGTVFTGGGGSPGPVYNFNAEIYYPPYFWKRDGSGQLARRPSIVSAPSAVALGSGFHIAVASGDSIKRVTAVRLGSVTHSLDADTRFTELSFTQRGSDLAVTAPGSANVTMRGYWMFFVIDRDGVPSVAKIVHLI